MMQNNIAERHTNAGGFTLIELAIVLVIIGLIIAGILTGQELVRTSEVRATITQMEKYNSAVNTFRGKYNALPGDMNAATANAFGFSPRSTSGAAGQGDGNGVIEGPGPNGFLQGGETLSFWVDLSVGNPTTPLNINYIDGSFSSYASPTVTPNPSIASTAIANYFPAAKLGRGNSVYVFSTNGVNYFGIGNITSTAAGVITAIPSMSINQAYQMDKKADDGFPVTGNITASLVNGNPGENAALSAIQINGSVSDSASSCYNTSTGATPGAYSNSFLNGSVPNCAVAIRFQ